MVLAELVAREANVALDEVMLLRHSNKNVKQLLAQGGSVEDYTFVQPVGSKYDYLNPEKDPIAVVVVIVNDAVYGVYRVRGVLEEGTTYSLASDAHVSFDVARNRPSRPAKRFDMIQLQSASLGLLITGWENRSRTTVQRSGGGFFQEVKVDAETATSSDALFGDFEHRVRESMQLGHEKRKRRLILAPKLPRRLTVTTTAFARNPDVVAEVLIRARGNCELCHAAAPFSRRSDASPYLEVHHLIRLADGGEDAVSNAVAVCPNCHRREHFG